jgi:hypothetical protein
MGGPGPVSGPVSMGPVSGPVSIAGQPALPLTQQPCHQHDPGSKAGATLHFAMISIRSGSKPRASQRCRNKLCLGGPNSFFRGDRNSPHHASFGGGGDAERSHGPKLNNIALMFYIARMMAAPLTVGRCTRPCDKTGAGDPIDIAMKSRFLRINQSTA